MADNILRTINTLTSRHFKPVWRMDDRYEAYRVCNLIRVKTGCLAYNWATFDEGYSYRNIFAEKWPVAKDEFVNLVFGWW